MKNTKKFTLTELLIVVAIIGILVSILMPSLQKAKEASYRAVCLSNQKQFYYMSLLFSKDNKSLIPRGGMNDGGGNEDNTAFSFYRMRKYLGVEEDVMGSISNNNDGYNYLFGKYDFYQCPAFSPEYKLTYTVNAMWFEKAAQGIEKGTHYKTTPKRGYDLITSPINPSETCLFTELGSNRVAPKNFSALNIWKYRDMPFNKNGGVEIDGRMLNKSSKEHVGKGVAVYHDGHAQIFHSKSQKDFPTSFIDGN